MLSLVAVSGGYSSLRCVGFSLQWLLLLQRTGSRHAGFHSCGSQALKRRLSSCGTRASLLRSMWEFPRPGLEPLSPALAGGFLTTAPPGKPRAQSFSENVPLDCELHKCFSVFFTPLSGTGRLELAGVGAFPSPRLFRLC